jgi:hypothetical protein
MEEAVLVKKKRSPLPRKFSEGFECKSKIYEWRLKKPPRGREKVSQTFRDHHKDNRLNSRSLGDDSETKRKEFL